jgi:hypothetical protein
MFTSHKVRLLKPIDTEESYHYTCKDKASGNRSSNYLRTSPTNKKKTKVLDFKGQRHVSDSKL